MDSAQDGVDMRARDIWSGVALCVALSSVGLTQEGPQPQTQTFRSETDLVILTATVTDRAGKRISTLQRESFAVFEDGVRQEVAFFGAGDVTPVSIAIVVDTSGSMVDKIDGVEDAVKHFLTTIKPEDEIFILKFNDRVELVAAFSGQRERLFRRAVENLRASGGTALYDAVAEGLEAVTQGIHKKKAVILLTDGNDTASQISRRDATELASSSEVLVYGLGIGHGERGSFGHLSFGHSDTVDIRVLEGFSNVTGGRAYMLDDAHRGGVDRIDEAVREVASELRQQYTLGYYPTNAKKDGGYRRIKVETTNRDYRVRTRAGYRAPPPPSSNQ